MFSSQPLTDREQRQGWVVTDAGECVEVTGYFCENPSDPKNRHPMWWCPDYGYSVPEASLHPDHLSAAMQALELARLKKAQAEVQIDRYDLLVRALSAAPPRKEQN